VIAELASPLMPSVPKCFWAIGNLSFNAIQPIISSLPAPRATILTNADEMQLVARPLFRTYV